MKSFISRKLYVAFFTILFSSITCPLIVHAQPLPSSQQSTSTQVFAGPKVDNDVDDIWHTSQTMSALTHIIGGYPRFFNHRNLGATWRSVWDDKNLYFLVEVLDNNIYTEGTQAWNKDSVEIYLDVNNSAGDYYDGQDDIQIIFPADGSDIQPGVNSSYLPSVNWSVTTTPLGYRMEIAIPWQSLGIIKPHLDQTLGVDLHVNDADSSQGRVQKLSTFATTDLSWSTPSTFGQLTLKRSRLSHYVGELMGIHLRNLNTITVSGDFRKHTAGYLNPSQGLLFPADGKTYRVYSKICTIMPQEDPTGLSNAMKIDWFIGATGIATVRLDANHERILSW